MIVGWLSALYHLIKRADCSEVKVEIRDDSSKLGKSANGLIELVLLSTVTPSERAGEGLAELYTSNSEDPYRFDCSNSRFTLNSEACSSAYGGMRMTASGAASCLKAAHRGDKLMDQFTIMVVDNLIFSIIFEDTAVVFDLVFEKICRGSNACCP
uniref:Uncharacterized protein n=1 Tax=Parascaris equorum TaxID=6256 RepID=A0A914RP82_PAREQ